jgi:hypothetical protein
MLAMFFCPGKLHAIKVRNGDRKKTLFQIYAYDADLQASAMVPSVA